MKTTNQLSIQQREEIAVFFKKIYGTAMKGGGPIMDDASFLNRSLARSTPFMIKQACKYIQSTQRAYVSANIFKSTSKGFFRRTEQYLWRFNHIVIDVDYMGNFAHDYGMLEENLEQSIIWHSISNGIPMPNYIVFTGSGGCHLYYTFEDLPNGKEKQMVRGIQATKMMLASRWVETEKYIDKIGPGYRVDLTATDSSRMLRIPGSLHERTGRMCRMKSTGAPKYTYKELCGMLQEKPWNGKYAVFNACREIEHSRSGYMHSSDKLFKRYIGGNMTAHCLGVKRLNELYGLAREGWGFLGCREKTAHLVWIWAHDAGLSISEIKDRLLELNRMFYAPLSERELFFTARGNGKSYKYTNERIRFELGLSSSDGYFVGSRSREFKNRAQKSRTHKKLISKLVLAGKKIAEISKELGLSISLIKRRRVEIKKTEGFHFWAEAPI